MRQPASTGKKPKVTARRHLRPAEANQLIAAAGQRGRHPFRDTVLLRLVYRHGLRASEAVGLRWSQIDLEAGWSTSPGSRAARTAPTRWTAINCATCASCVSRFRASMCSRPSAAAC
ncbi:MAG: tyrosine-type recombinase/integrase [Acetobacteraceae bacterium]|nr:tyrosine-type recombinase/integrase [Acetobacteraceae bacterium]